MQELLKKTTQTLTSLPRVHRCKGTVWCRRVSSRDTSLCPGRWSFLMLLLGITLLANLGYAAPIGTQRQADKNMVTYVHNGNICYKCGPGTFVVKHCTSNFTYSDCDPCPVDHYQSNPTRAESCGRCRSHCPDDHMVVVQSCSATHDLKCECKSGYYRHVDKDHEFMNHHVCKKHTVCPFGQVIVKPGTSTSDMVCSQCPEGQFYNSYGQCENCTTCSDRHMTQLTPCWATSDAVCKALHTTISVTPSVMTSKSPPGFNGSDIIWLVVACVSLLVIAMAVVAVICYCHRCTGEKRMKDIELNESSPHRPMLERSFSSSSTTSTIVSKRQRTLSSGSDTSTVTVTGAVSVFPELQDRDVWKHQVFELLSKRLNSNWKMFMRMLPGDKTYKSDIDHRCQQITLDEQGDIREQVYKALKEWSGAHEDKYVKVDFILITLSRIGGCDKVGDEVRKLCCKIAREQKRSVPKEQSISEM